MNVAVTGATGRMGREVLEEAQRRGFEIALAMNREPGEARVGDVAVRAASGATSLLGERDVDALVDFSGPETSLDYVEACADTGTPAVVGTTGFDDAGESRLRAASERVALLRAANFSRGVQALTRAVSEAVASLPGYDIELTETHHNAKRDAPSGTAKELLEQIEEERGHGEQVHGRVGDAPRETDEIGVHARRAGDVTGEHELLLAGNHEVVSLTHRAGHRGVFAAGALDAATWLADKNPGYYTFSDVVGGTE